METLGKRLRQRRLELNLTLEQVAKGAGLGTGTVSDIEQGRQKGTTKLHKIAELLRVHVKWLEEGTGPMEAKERMVDPTPFSTHGILVTREGAQVGAEWDKIEGEEYRRLVVEFVEGMVAAQKRANRLQKETESASKAPIKGKPRPTKLD